MAKLYSRINWVNAPLTTTPVGATLLNKMDKGIDDLDNKIEELYGNQNQTLLGVTTGNNTLVLPADFKELRVVVKNSATASEYYCIIPKEMCVNGYSYREGHYLTSTSNGGIGVIFTTSGTDLLVGLNQFYINSVNNIATTTATFYYV